MAARVNARYPALVIDLARCQDAIAIEGKIHGYQKQHIFPSRPARRQVTEEMRQCKTWAEAVETARRWAVIRYEAAPAASEEAH